MIGDYGARFAIRCCGSLVDQVGKTSRCELHSSTLTGLLGSSRRTYGAGSAYLWPCSTGVWTRVAVDGRATNLVTSTQLIHRKVGNVLPEYTPAVPRICFAGFRIRQCAPRDAKSQWSKDPDIATVDSLFPRTNANSLHGMPKINGPKSQKLPLC